MSNLASGTMVGRYKIDKFLGAGAMGEVYLADDPHIDRKLAIKTVRLSGRESDVEDRKRRLLREARAAGRMLHPNIVTLFDAGEAEGLVFLAFEYVEGADLANRLESGPALSISDVLRWTRQTAEALAYAHDHDVVHRDVKPSNILIDSLNQVKVTDFGIAKMGGQSTELTIAGSVMGSPQYLSPEQIRGEDLDGRSDVFSLGVVLYELLSGKRPFDGETLTTLVYKILHQEPPPVSALRAVPERLEALLVRMLAKDRDQRIGSAREVAAELRAIERDLPDETLARPVVPAGVSVRPPVGRETAPMTQPAAMFGGGAGTVPTPGASTPTVRTPTPAFLPAATMVEALPPGTIQPPPAASHAQVAIPPLPLAPPRRVPLPLIFAVAIAVLLVGVLGVWRVVSGGKPDVPQVGLPPADEAGTSDQPADSANPAQPVDPTATASKDPMVFSVPPGTPIDGRGAPRPSTLPGPIAATQGGQTVPAPAPAPSATPPPRPWNPAPAPASPAAPDTTEDEPEPAPAPARPSGDALATRLNLALRVVPPDAFVLVDRTLVGKVSEFNGLKGSGVLDVAGGEHTLKFRKAGMEDLVIQIDASGIGTTVIPGRLKALAARDVSAGDLDMYQVRDGITLRLEPPEATVTVDGSAVRLTSGPFGRRSGAFIALGPGTHRVSISAPGYQRKDIGVEVRSGAEEGRQKIDIHLDRDNG
ncbi:MAG TPA: protein kinase [Thermoanaerobaculia bacterium]|jgi:serine/threonine-protein kinase|nr:protein kinase [Thermoanaerobaculia bacterium]